ncbi:MULTISPECIES: MaoC/PaaZ C-terminal domain-containing protein [Nocardiaceae]|uniref:MaoC/PaaZ C-terminal domain-containing protein n=1 Tax=Nocardiaceae TaxID=85025 RepID=UPI00050CBF7A|nr:MULTISPECIES: MaoC/PaaZ C-terminal domain-containing protein [Rhodococcus]KJV03543.1 hypothetical protein VF34_01533 [Rhodococcus sp. PML026]
MTNTQTVAAPTVGEELTPFTRDTGFANWNRYAAVNDEFVPIHMDDEAGRIAGQSGAFGMGNLQWSYLHNLVRQWAGDNAVILSMSCQFRKPNTKGTVTAHGRVTSVDSTEEGTEVGLELWTEDAVGDKMAPGAARVLLR